MKDLSKIMLIISLAVASAVVIPIIVLVLRTAIAYGGIDLIIFAFLIVGVLPNILLGIPVVICLKQGIKDGIYYRYSILIAIVLILWSLYLVVGLVQTRHMLHIWW